MKLPSKARKTIAIMGGKGGAGKSTIASLLAASLQRENNLPEIDKATECRHDPKRDSKQLSHLHKVSQSRPLRHSRSVRNRLCGKPRSAKIVTNDQDLLPAARERAYAAGGSRSSHTTWCPRVRA